MDSGRICDIKSVSMHYQTPVPGKGGRTHQPTTGGYINGAGAFCWVESYVYLYWTNLKTGARQFQDIRDKLKLESNDARLTQKRLNRFLELNRGKVVELERGSDGRLEISNLDDLDYGFID